jgi:4-methyl-5(b-hydroxyethyl)-thiazole monophosphate biosynthesis
MRKNVLIPLAEGFEEIEAVTLVDILRRADVNVVTVSLHTSLHVKGAHAISVVADAFLSEQNPEYFDMIVLPGGLPGATNLAADATVQHWLQTFDAQGKEIAAICAAPYALYTAGVLKERFTCYPDFHSRILQKGYDATEKVVQSMNVTTSQGPSTAMDFALTLVEKLCSKRVVDELREALLLA